MNLDRMSFHFLQDIQSIPDLLALFHESRILDIQWKSFDQNPPSHHGEVGIHPLRGRQGLFHQLEPILLLMNHLHLKPNFLGFDYQSNQLDL